MPWNTSALPALARERLAGVLGTSFGLALLAGLILFLVAQPTGVVEGASLFGQWFEPRALPFGLRVMEGARQSRGEELVILADPGAPPEAPKLAPTPGQERAPVDFAKLPPGPAGLPPIEVMIVCYPPDVAREELEKLFPIGSGLNDPGHGGGGGGPPPGAIVQQRGQRLLIDRGQLPWGDYSASYVYEREIEPGPTFVDSMRVNLTTPDRPCVLFARWPRGAPASKERLADVLAALEPHE